MFYVYPITVPHTTLETSPQITYLDLAPGEIQQVEIGFPFGCAGLVHVQIWRSEHQVWPTNVDGSFAFNDYNVRFAEAEDSLGPADHWSVRTWNDDVRHGHTIRIRILIIEKQKTMLGRIAESLFGRAGIG
jgi:hypothetical protein